MRLRKSLWAASGMLCLTLVAAESRTASRMPYAKAGLTERQAAAHLLDRFAFGARPGEVDRVTAMGLDRWLDQQLAGNLSDLNLETRLKPYDALNLSADQLAARFPNMGAVRQMAVRDGVMSRDETVKDGNPKEYRRKLMAYAREKGLHPQQELIQQMMAQKLLRGVYSENQLHEVLTDFWFNHFNVSMTDNQARPFILSYERDAIRPYVTAKFRDMLEATAKHPAMLLYLDNAQSNAPAGAMTTMQAALGNQRRVNRRAALQRQAADSDLTPPPARPKKAQRGLNENYARELMELHTLGVDGGYAQKDVIEVARALTGWTIYRPNPASNTMQKRPQMAKRAGFVQEGMFLFRAGTHDAGEKTILGEAFPAGGGIGEGERVLNLLANKPATARHLAKKLAVRFVSDTPSPPLVDRLAQTYLNSKGDLKAVVRAIAESPEFWSRESLQAKIKSPFELAASAVRALDGDIRQPRPLIQWINRMGQPLYAYQQPTGYPDRAQAWVNTGSLLNRMNFGLQLAAGQVPGVRFDLAKLNGGREPESDEAALKTYVKLLMPERDLTETLKRLTPAVRDPNFADKVNEAAPVEAEDAVMADSSPPNGKRRMALARANAAPPSRLAAVVGVILGSPEFQRR